MPNSIEFIDTSGLGDEMPRIDVIVGKSVVVGHIERDSSGRWSYNSAYASAAAISADSLEKLKAAVTTHIVELRTRQV